MKLSEALKRMEQTYKDNLTDVTISLRNIGVEVWNEKGEYKSLLELINEVGEKFITLLKMKTLKNQCVNQ